MTENEFKEEMTWFAEYYEKNMNRIQGRMWFDIFKRFRKDDFHEGLMSHLQTSKTDRFPAIGEVREKTLLIVQQKNEDEHSKLRNLERIPWTLKERQAFRDMLPEAIRNQLGPIEEGQPQRAGNVIA